MVWAICGRMPLMMQSAPMSRVAATVFIKCCATNVSTVGTPVMSMIAILAPVSTTLQQILHDHLCPLAVQRADEGQRHHFLPQLNDGSGQLHHFLLLSMDHRLTTLLIDLGRVKPQPVQEYGEVPEDLSQLFAVLTGPLLREIEQGLLERKHEGRGLGRTKSLNRACLGDFG